MATTYDSLTISIDWRKVILLTMFIYSGHHEVSTFFSVIYYKTQIIYLKIQKFVKLTNVREITYLPLIFTKSPQILNTERNEVFNHYSIFTLDINKYLSFHYNYLYPLINTDPLKTCNKSTLRSSQYGLLRLSRTIQEYLLLIDYLGIFPCFLLALGPHYTLCIHFLLLPSFTNSRYSLDSKSWFRQFVTESASRLWYTHTVQRGTLHSYILVVL